MHKCIVILLFAIFSSVISETCTRDGDVRKKNERKVNDLIQVCFDNGDGLQWTYVCTTGWANQNNLNTDIFCKRWGYLGIDNGDFRSRVLQTNDQVKLTSVNCMGNETSLTQCSFNTMTEECELVARLRCEECSLPEDCRITANCIESSKMKTCACINGCMNNGYCFDETCVCQHGFNGASCENLIELEIPSPTSDIQTTLSSSNQSISTPSASNQSDSMSSSSNQSISTLSSSNQSISTQTSSTSSNTLPQPSIGSTRIIEDQTNISTFPPEIMDVNIRLSPALTPNCISNDCEESTNKPIVNGDFILIMSGCIIAAIICVIISILSVVIPIVVCCFCRKRKGGGSNTLVYLNSRVNDLELARNSTVINLASSGVIECYPEIAQDIESLEIIYEELPCEESLQNYVAINTLCNPHHFLNLPQISTDQSSIQTDLSYLTSDGFTCFYEIPNSIENSPTTPSEMEDNVLYLAIDGQEDEDNIYHVITESILVESKVAQKEISIIESLKCDNYKSSMMDYVDPSYNLEELETSIGQGSFDIPIEKLNNLETLASGNFGIVYRAIYSNVYGNIHVAIKTLKNEANDNLKVSFIREAAILAQFNHPNILGFIGVVTRTMPHMMITELLKMELKKFLRQLKNTELIVTEKTKTSNLLTRFCKEIVSGMEYLAGKKFIHRDLAARNVLVAKDMTCRIADFGMCRNIMSVDYYTSEGGQIPLRWTSPEAILYMKYSEKSDVWAYGVTMYEIWAFGERPWAKETNSEIIENIIHGKYLPKPINCTEEIYQIMLETWKQDAKKRPTFSQLKRKLDLKSKRDSEYVIDDIDEVIDENYVEMAFEH